MSNIWGPPAKPGDYLEEFIIGKVFVISLIISIICYFYAFWIYVKAKGYSGVHGILYALFNIFGIITIDITPI